MILRIIGLAMLAVGIVFLVFGLQAQDTVGETLRHEISGEYSNETRWQIGGGIAGIVIGGGLALFGGRLRGPTKPADSSA